MARCIKSIPNENKNEFLIGINNQKNSFLTVAEFDENNNKTKLVDLVDYESINTEEVKRSISNVIDVYPVKNNFFISQLYDSNINKNIISTLLFKRNEDNSINLEKDSIKNNFLDFSDENFFE